MEQRVLTKLRKDFQVGSEDWNDVAFTGQRIRWTQDSQNGPYIEVSQNKAIDELEEIPVERNTKEDLQCTPSMHTIYRSLLGQINWLQSRTQFQCCYKISRCASMQASPTIGDVKALNKLATQIKSQPEKLQYWPLRTLGFPDASHRNNHDGSTPRGMTVFFDRIARAIFKDGMVYGSLIDYESQKIKKTVLSYIHMRTDAKNPVTTARTIHFPEQWETIHMISMLRKKPVQEVFMILLTFQPKIAQQTASQRLQPRRTI